MDDRKLNKVLIGGIFGVILVWIFFMVATMIIFNKIDPENVLKNASAFGDAFGSINALFSALAFAFLIYTALLQKKELELQREELKETKAEIAKSAEAHQELVTLTQKQLDLQSKLRRSDIRPELKLIRIQKDIYNDTTSLLIFHIISDNKFKILGHMVHLNENEPEPIYQILKQNNFHPENIEYSFSMKFLNTKLDVPKYVTLSYLDIDENKYFLKIWFAETSILGQAVSSIFESEIEPSI